MEQIIFFNTCMKKAHFLRRKVNRKSYFARSPTVAGGKDFSSRYMTTQYARPPIHFSYKKKVLFLHLLKKVLCVTREQLTFSDSDDDLSTREPLMLNHHPR